MRLVRGKATMTLKDPQQAFAEAIEDGRLSTVDGSANDAGLYMYMGTDAAGKDLFKNTVTRKYDV